MKLQSVIFNKNKNIKDVFILIYYVNVNKCNMAANIFI